MAKIMKAPYGENIQKLLKKQDSPFYFYDLDSLENHLKGIAIYFIQTLNYGTHVRQTQCQPF